MHWLFVYLIIYWVFTALWVSVLDLCASATGAALWDLSAILLVFIESCFIILSCFAILSCLVVAVAGTHLPPLWFGPEPPVNVVHCGHANAVALSMVNKPAAINVLIFFIFVCSMKALVPVIKLAIIRKNRSYNIVWDPNGSGVHMLFNAVFKLGLSL